MITKADIKFLDEKHWPTDVSGLRPSMTRECNAALALQLEAGTPVGHLECQRRCHPGDFPGGPVVQTSCFRRRGLDLILVWGTGSYMLHSAAKKKQTKQNQRERVPSTFQKLSPIQTKGDSGIPTLSHPPLANPTHLSFGREPSPPGPRPPRSSHEWLVSLWPGPPRPLLEVSHRPRRGPAQSTSDGTVVYSL